MELLTKEERAHLKWVLKTNFMDENYAREMLSRLLAEVEEAHVANDRAQRIEKAAVELCDSIDLSPLGADSRDNTELVYALRAALEA